MCGFVCKHASACTVGVKKELGIEEMKRHPCMHAGCIRNIMSPYVNVQYWEYIVHAFSGR